MGISVSELSWYFLRSCMVVVDFQHKSQQSEYILQARSLLDSLLEFKLAIIFGWGPSSL